jgi:hypothetical protein
MCTPRSKPNKGGAGRQEMPLIAVSRMLGLTNKSGAKAYIVSARRKLTARMSIAAVRKSVA